ncbi:MAG: hypothetical protein AVDCRST_MAG04-2877, partial [uncultured Acetobacteraceae bacterium]
CPERPEGRVAEGGEGASGRHGLGRVACVDGPRSAPL